MRKLTCQPGAVTSHVFLLELPPERRWRMLQMGRQRRLFFFPSRMLGVSTFLVFHGLRHFSEIETNWLVVSSVCFFPQCTVYWGLLCKPVWNDLPSVRHSMLQVNTVTTQLPLGQQGMLEIPQGQMVFLKKPKELFNFTFFPSRDDLDDLDDQELSRIIFLCNFYISPRIHKPLIYYIIFIFSI